MRIERLRAVNVKRIEEIDLLPGEAALIIVGGNNGAGKSSVLDSIYMTVGGAAAVPDRPIRDGQEEAFVEVDLGEWVATRRWTHNDSGDLTVRNKEGDRKSKPQSWLDGLVGPLSFDPLDFTRMKPAEQATTLRTLVGLDTSDLDNAKARAYEERTGVNRMVKNLEARMLATPAFGADVPDEPISVADLSGRLAKAMEQNQERSLAEAAIANAKRTISGCVAKVEALRRELQAEETRLSGLQKMLTDQEAKLNLTTSVDVAPIRAAISGAEQTNVKVRAKKERAILAAELSSQKAASDELTKHIAEFDTEKGKRLAEAAFPVPELSLDGETITYQGVPFAQCSDAEKLRVSLAMGIALNPTLKVILIRDGSLLDHDSLRIVEEMAVAAGIQVWLERVGTDGPVTYVIEEGRVKSSVPEGGAELFPTT
jgi:hypothetical protein